jgi:hypothetical protein
MEFGFMARLIVPCVIGVLSLLMTDLGRAAGPTQVESLGASDRLVIEGTSPTISQSLGSALLNDPELLWLGHPLAPRGDFLHSLRVRAELGLKHSGYPDARVDVTLDERSSPTGGAARECVVLRVREGQRYVAGEPRVSGAKPDIAARLRRAVCESTAPPDALPRSVDLPGGRSTHEWRGSDGGQVEMRPPLWPVGKSAAFDAPTRDRIRAELTRSLADIGHDSPRLRVDIRKPAKGTTAELFIDLVDLGPASIVREIEVVGGPKNSRQVVLDFLKLAEGRKVTQLDRLRWEDQLRSSGRFVRHEIKLERRFGGDGVKLKFSLEEYPHAPALNEALSREEQALQRCRDWLLRMDAEGYEFVVVRDGDKADTETGWLKQIALSPNRGLIVSTRTAQGVGPTLCLMSNRLACYLPRGAGRFDVPLETKAGVFGTLELTLTDENERNEQPFRLSFSGGVRSSNSEGSVTNTGFQFRFDPVFFLALAHEKNATAQWESNTLVLTTADATARIDSQSGRLIEMVFAERSELDHISWRLTTERGALDRQLAELRALPGPNHYQPGRPITSLANFLGSAQTMSELARFLPNQGPAAHSSIIALGGPVAGMLRRCAEQNAFGKLDAQFTALSSDQSKNTGLEITIPPALPASQDAQASPDNPLKPLAGYLVRLSDLLFERNTWPATLLRLAGSMVANETKYAQYDLMRIYGSSEVGPVGFLATSSVVPIPIFAATFAQKGRERLATDDFRRDYQLLLGPLERASATPAIVAALNGLSREEALQLGSQMLNDGPLFAEFVDQVRKSASKASPKDALAQSLEAWWEKGLKARLDAELRERSSLDTARKAGGKQ